MPDERIHAFRKLHESGTFVVPNPWDAGSARLLAGAGFQALATTSSGHAASLGRTDGRVTREEALDHARTLAAATPLPLSADLENGYGSSPEHVAETVELASATGLAGCSIEDYDRDGGALYERGQAVERIRAAAQAAHGHGGLVLTARAEGLLRGQPDLAEVIARLQAFQEAGADVLYAPGLREIEAIRSLVSSVDLPVNVLLLPGGPNVHELAEAGVRRVSVGGALSLHAHAAVLEAARELLEQGTATFWQRTVPALPAIRAALES